MYSDFQAVGYGWDAGGRGFLPIPQSRNKEFEELGGIGDC